MAGSAVEICNLALANCEADGTIETIDLGNIDPEDIGEEERLCAQWYEPLRLQALRDHEWNFAVNDIALTALASYVAIDTRWAYGYQMPNGVRFWRIINPVNSSPVNFRIINDDREGIEQMVILTNESNAIGTFSRDVTDPTKFDSQFVLGFSWLIAAHICGSLTGSRVNRQHCLAMYGSFMPAAKADDANEQKDNPAYESETIASWHSART